jgi:outer membrane lipoprotein-sorting protein
MNRHDHPTNCRGPMFAPRPAQRGEVADRRSAGEGNGAATSRGPSPLPSPRYAGRGQTAAGDRSHSGFRGVLAVVSIVAVQACSCAHAPPKSRPYPAPASDALIASLTARQSALGGMNARVRATSWLGGERIRATVNMLVMRDGRLRFEAEVSLQGTVATLATDGTTFALFDARRNEVNRGPACPANVASLIRIPLLPADVAAVLLGDARLPANIPEGGLTVAWDPSRGADALAIRDKDGGDLQLFFRADRTLTAVVRTAPDGVRLWQTAYGEFETVAGVVVPRLIRFAEGTGSFDDGVEIQFKDRTLNPTPPAGAFTLAPPAGAAVRDVGCPDS